MQLTHFNGKPLLTGRWLKPRPLAAAALSRETDKINMYAAECSKLNLVFHPLVMDTYGGIPPNTVQCVLNSLINKVKNFVPPNWVAPTQLKPTGIKGSL